MTSEELRKRALDCAAYSPHTALVFATIHLADMQAEANEIAKQTAGVSV